MAKLFVTYPAAAGERFDRDYYVATHIPLVLRKWGPSGLRSAEAYLPVGDDAVDVAVAVLTFADDGAIDTALAAPETADVLGDLENFTDIAPKLSRGVDP